MKKKILISLATLIIIILTVLIILDFNNKNVQFKNQKFNGLDMTSSKIIVEDGMSSFQTTIVNNTGKDYKLNKFTIIVKDKNNKVIAEIPSYDETIIKNGETKKIGTAIDIDLSSASSIEYSDK